MENRKFDELREEIRLFFSDPSRHFHDRSTQWLFQDRDYLQALLKMLNEELTALIDFSRLTVMKRSFIPETLREQEADLIFQGPFMESEGADADEIIIYILIEHQSKPDVLMGFRLLSYMLQIWTSQYRDWSDEGLPLSELRFYPILPIVYYTGTNEWKTPLSLEAVMDVPEVLSRFIPSFDVLFLGVNETAPEDLIGSGHPLGWLLRVLQEEHSDKDVLRDVLIEALSGLDALSDVPEAQRHHAFVYLLLLIMHRRAPEERQELVKLVDDHVREMEVDTMAQTIADELIQQGREQGLEQGREQGLEQGREQGLEQGREQGLEQGREQERQLWRAWYTRQQAAQKRGEDFTEPPPPENGK